MTHEGSNARGRPNDTIDSYIPLRYGDNSPPWAIYLGFLLPFYVRCVAGRVSQVILAKAKNGNSSGSSFRNLNRSTFNVQQQDEDDDH